MVGIENYRPLLDRFASVRAVRADHSETAIILRAQMNIADYEFKHVCDVKLARTSDVTVIVHAAKQIPKRSKPAP
jgi:hypothetical protein